MKPEMPENGKIGNFNSMQVSQEGFTQQKFLSINHCIIELADGAEPKSERQTLAQSTPKILWILNMNVKSVIWALAALSNPHLTTIWAQTPATHQSQATNPAYSMAGQIAASTPDQRKLLIRNFLNLYPNQGLALIAAVQTNHPDMSKMVFDTVIEILAESSATAHEVEKITQAFPQLLAQGQNQIEPAAGPNRSSSKFESSLFEKANPYQTPENPSQLINPAAISPN